MKVVAIVVTHNPELTQLAALLSAIRGQLDHVVVVDDHSAARPGTWLAEEFPGWPGLEVLELEQNLGIAAAQNKGIERARGLGPEYVILFDQDSEPALDMVRQLIDAAEQKKSMGVALAAVGPRYVDEPHGNPPPFRRVEGLSVARLRCARPDSVVEVDYLIASGCLIPVSVFDAIGGMYEPFFIDYVDIEWGLRARRMGYRCFGVCAALMRHSLGDDPIEFLGMRIPLHSPLRHYYHFRNAIWMYRQSWLPPRWKIADGWRLFLKYGFYTLYAKPPLQHLGKMTLGIWHGLIGKMGKFDPD